MKMLSAINDKHETITFYCYETHAKRVREDKLTLHDVFRCFLLLGDMQKNSISFARKKKKICMLHNHRIACLVFM